MRSASTNITIDTTNNTLTGLKEAINESGAAVTAAIVNVGTTASPDYRLIVKSKDTGTANAASITSTLSGGNTNDPFAAGGSVVQAAADAAFTVDGLSVTRSSNTVSDVIGGVTFTLLKAGDSSNISVANDTGSISKKIQSFVDAYNAVIQIANAHYTLDPTTNQQGVLASDPVLRGVVSQLRAEVSAISRGGTSYSYLSDIGVRFEDDGTLALDSSVLSEALNDNSDGVQKLFLSIDGGIGKRIPDLIDDFIDSIDGVITARQDGIGASIKSIDEKVVREEERIALFELRLVNEFAALESLIAQLNTQSDFLAQQFASLPSIGGN